MISPSYSLSGVGQDDRAFSAEEEEKLQGAFELEGDDLHMVLETSAFILEQVGHYFENWTYSSNFVTTCLIEMFFIIFSGSIS